MRLLALHQKNLPDETTVGNSTPPPCGGGVGEWFSVDLGMERAAATRSSFLFLSIYYLYSYKATEPFYNAY